MALLAVPGGVKRVRVCVSSRTLFIPRLPLIDYQRTGATARARVGVIEKDILTFTALI
jgi:hypothetical protein